MTIIDDCVQFLEDLLLGDFNEQQMMSAQIVGGVISLVPVMDQVMDARDVSGNLYRINKQGGFAKATLEQKIDFGFAAFGVVPEIGSAFKTIFKPVYKQRKAAKGVINSGVAMIELMLGQRKGGAVRWVRALDWAGNTQAAIVQANMALESCIALLDTLGEEHWWCPDRLRNLARDVAPGLKALRGQLDRPIREASVEIRQFLEDMLGEHAAAVALAIAGNAAVLPRTGHGQSHRPVGAANTTRHTTIGSAPRTQGRKAQGAVATSVQKLAFETYAVLEHSVKGLLGEHIVDHYVIEHKGWGLDWNRHDMIGPASESKTAGWQGKSKKMNDESIPTYLCTPSGRVYRNGIDSLWLTDRARPQQYAVVEAKANMNPKAKLIHLLGEAKSSPVSTSETGSGRRRQHGAGRPASSARRSGNAVANDPARKKIDEVRSADRVMQMSREWIEERIIKEFFQIKHLVARNYTRHVCLVTPVEAAEHVQVVAKILSEGLVSDPTGAQRYANEHAVHRVAREFDESELEIANDEYKVNGKPAPSKRTGRRKGTG